jgi:hypothetical protein
LPDALLWMLPEHTLHGSWGAVVLGPTASAVTSQQAQPGLPPEWLTRAIGRDSQVIATPVPSVTIREPELTLIAAVPTRAGRVLELLVRPALGTYSIRIWAIDMTVLSAEVDGHSIDGGRYRTRSPQWTLGYVAPSDNGFALKLTVPRDSPVRFDLIARSLGLPEEVVIPRRPRGVVPFQTGDITVVYRRVDFENVGTAHSGM